MRRALAIALLLLAVTTPLAVWSFRLYYRDFFYLREVYRAPAPADRERLMEIADGLDYRDRRNTTAGMMLAEALLHVGEEERGVKIIRSQARLYPDDPGILHALANALAEAGETEEADRIFRRLMGDLLKGDVAPRKEGSK